MRSFKSAQLSFVLRNISKRFSSGHGHHAEATKAAPKVSTSEKFHEIYMKEIEKIQKHT